MQRPLITLVGLILFSPACLFFDSSETNNGDNNGDSNNGVIVNNGLSNNGMPVNNGLTVNNGVTINNNGTTPTNNGTINPPILEPPFGSDELLAFVVEDVNDVDITYMKDTGKFAIAMADDEGTSVTFLTASGDTESTVRTDQIGAVQNVAISADGQGVLVGTDNTLYYCDSDSCVEKKQFTGAVEVMPGSETTEVGVPRIVMFVRYPESINYGVWNNVMDDWIGPPRNQNLMFSNVQLTYLNRGFVATAVSGAELYFFGDITPRRCLVPKNVAGSRGVNSGELDVAIYSANDTTLSLYSCESGKEQKFSPTTLADAYDVNTGDEAIVLTTYSDSTITAQSLASSPGAAPEGILIGNVNIGVQGIKKIESASNAGLVIVIAATMDATL